MLDPPDTWPLESFRTTLGAPPPPLSAEGHLLECVCDGASVALHALLRYAHLAGVGAYVPALWDERVVPLCAAGALCAARAPMASFLWDGSMPAHVVPTLANVSELVRTVVERLCMMASEVVIVMALLESLLVKHDHVLQVHSARPVLLAACILTRKLTRDADLATLTCVAAVEDVFTALTPVLGARIERQLLEYLDWRVPNDPDLYNRHTIELLRSGTPPGMLPPSIVDVPWMC